CSLRFIMYALQTKKARCPRQTGSTDLSSWSNFIHDVHSTRSRDDTPSNKIRILITEKGNDSSDILACPWAADWCFWVFLCASICDCGLFHIAHYITWAYHICRNAVLGFFKGNGFRK